MSQQDQWRFQWPDGTWIRWNPLTQSWEKESPNDPEATGVPLTTLVEEEADAIVEVEERAPDAEFVPEEPVEPNGRAPEEEEPQPSRSQRRAIPTTRRARPMVQDVLSEDDASRGPLWPTIVVGAVTGVGIGLVVLEVMRG